MFGLLADPNRLRLLVSLLEGGELCVCDLAGVSRTWASRRPRMPCDSCGPTTWSRCAGPGG